MMPTWSDIVQRKDSNAELIKQAVILASVEQYFKEMSCERIFKILCNKGVRSDEEARAVARVISNALS